MAVIDSYTDATSADYNLYSGTLEIVSQSITGNGGALGSVVFLGRKVGSPPGNVVAKIYAIDGTHGMDAMPTGSPLATSDNVAASSFSASNAEVTFNFSGANQITLANGTNYAVTCEYTSGSAFQSIILRGILGGSHAGNVATFFFGEWGTEANNDLYFIVNTPAAAATGNFFPFF